MRLHMVNVRMRVGKPLFCEAWRLACGWTRRMYTPSSRGSKRNADKNVDAVCTSCLALREGKTTHSQPKAENQPNHRVSPSLVTLGPLSVSNNHNNNTRPLGCISPHPIGVCCLCLYNCNASHFRQAFACVINRSVRAFVRARARAPSGGSSRTTQEGYIQ